ncbi:MAG: imidazole glycerol phosphate synthase subunit HisH [Armatimonadetes bacterium]|nr:imidazole glycerol phosphate synthase subunit HisH [Armatimonadota bacterium]
MIRIIDYGMGNLRSVQKALERLGFHAALTQNPHEILEADRLILPGVGAFGAAMVNLERLGLVEAIREFVRSGRPLLGICLGMQLLLSESQEQGLFRGLDIIPGRVVKFFKPEDLREATSGLKVPHMGWNTLARTGDCPLLKGVPDQASVYFVHSYYPDPPREFVAATTDYGIDFCSVIWKDNIYATQFHPEKSGTVGLRMLENFAAIE